MSLPTNSKAVQRGEADLLDPGRRRLTWLDGAGIALMAAVLLLISYLRSRNRIFWGDEIFGWTMLRESSFGKLYSSWSNGADSSGLLYYVFGRPWLRLFGATELSARMFTAAAIAASLGVTWITARRYFSLGVVSFCVPFVFLSNPLVLVQLSNARTYGLFLLATAAVAYFFLEAEPGRDLTPLLLVGTALAHAFLVGSHILGFLYSIFFVAGLVAQDLWLRTLRPKLYLSAMAGWTFLLFEWRNIAATASVGKPYFFTDRPLLSDLPVGMVAYGTTTLKLCALLFAIALGAFWGRREMGVSDRLLPPSRTPLYFLIGTFFSIPVFLFLKSFVGNSVFLDRYLIPALLGSAFLLCELASRILDLAGRSRFLNLRIALGALVLAALCFRMRPLDHPDRTGDYTTRLVREIPPGIPVVVTDVSIFAEMAFYQNPHAKLETEIDWPFTLDRSTGVRDVTGANMLAIWKKLGYYSDQILPASEVLAQPEFIVVSREHFPLWFQERIRNNPMYQVTDMGTAGQSVLLHVWRVRRR